MVRGLGGKSHKPWRAVKVTSSITAGLEAIEEAMRIKAGVPTIIFTDSKAAIKAIEKRPGAEKY
jgi:hypothetical protein